MPALGQHDVFRCRRQVDRWFDATKHLFEHGAALALGHVDQRSAAFRQQVEDNEGRWRGKGQLRDAGLDRMQALLQGVEVETAGGEEHDLAVDD